MARKKQKFNPNCAVAGCGAKQPHRKEKYVDALMAAVELPHVMCQYVIDGLSALGDSALTDLANRNALGFLTRQRQIQELRIRHFICC